MSLDRSMGEGVLGVEINCEYCDENIELIYQYHEHCWRGECRRCRAHHLVDLEQVIYQAKYGPHADWDAALNQLWENNLL